MKQSEKKQNTNKKPTPPAATQKNIDRLLQKAKERDRLAAEMERQGDKISAAAMRADARMTRSLADELHRKLYGAKVPRIESGAPKAKKRRTSPGTNRARRFFEVLAGSTKEK